MLLPIYLSDLGFSSLAIGAIIASSLVGTAVLTLWVGWVANQYSRRRLLLAAALLMAATGLGFAATRGFWPLLIIAFVGTANPTSGDASIFLPIEQTVLAQTIDPDRRTALFARYSVVGSLIGALGVLAASAPDFLVHWTGFRRDVARQFMFALYGVLGIAAFFLYRPLSGSVEAARDVSKAPLQHSKRLIYGRRRCLGLTHSEQDFSFRCSSLSGCIGVSTSH